MIKGQCLCGAIHYTYHAEIEQSILCFCQDCRLAQGALFGWNSPIDQQAFEITQGERFLTSYFHTSNKARVFCIQCGSPLYSYRLDLPNVLRLRLGSITEGEIPSPNETFYSQYQPDFIQIINCLNK